MTVFSMMMKKVKYNIKIYPPRPSPRPKRTRQKIKAGTDFANKGVIDVETDQRNTANNKTAFPPNLLAAQAPITYLKLYYISMALFKIDTVDLFYT